MLGVLDKDWAVVEGGRVVEVKNQFMCVLIISLYKQLLCIKVRSAGRTGLVASYR